MDIFTVKWRNMTMKPTEYNWKATIRSGHRITVPEYIIEDWDLKEGDKIYVMVTNVSKTIAESMNVVTDLGDK